MKTEGTSIPAFLTLAGYIAYSSLTFDANQSITKKSSIYGLMVKRAESKTVFSIVLTIAYSAPCVMVVIGTHRCVRKKPHRVIYSRS